MRTGTDHADTPSAIRASSRQVILPTQVSATLLR
jgi:hypothetical protein